MSSPRLASLAVLLGAGLLGSGLPGLAHAAFPLEHTRLDVAITGPVAEMTVEQVFRNPHDTFVEATYVFPLHEQAAVDAAAMHIGNREIRAEIHEREEARARYEDARASGRAASLTEQERPNLFTQSVANIPPGEEIRVLLHVVQPLAYDDGIYVFHAPLVAGPRFVGGGVEDAERITPPVVSEGATDEAALGHRVELSVVVDMGLPLVRGESPSHPALDLVDEGEGRAFGTLRDVRADRDFVLELEPGGDEPQLSFLAHQGHFSLLLEPQSDPAPSEVVPRELIFVVDTSGSMRGTPTTLVKEAMREALSGLLPGDAFQVIRFSDAASQLSPKPLPATDENIARGLAYVEELAGNGGTHMMAGIEAALAYDRAVDPNRGERRRIVCLMTDGYIGNEREILATVADRVGDARLFAFGIGSSVNRHLLERIAEVGRGAADILLLEDLPEDAVEDFYARIARPVLTDVEIDWGEMAVHDVHPADLPDLFAGQPIRVVGRYDGAPGSIVVRGRVGEGSYREEVALRTVERGEGIPSLWARARVADLEKHLLWGEVEDVREEIVQTALAYRLLSRYTAFVAVERRIRNPEGYALSLDQPVEMPAGVSQEGVFGSELSRHHMRPGDPLLTVDAPADARSVTALLPWGEMVPLDWDRERQRWYHRFLVPRGTEEGAYVIEIFVTLADGTLEVREQDLEVDATAPEFDVEAEITAEGDTRVRLYVDEPLRTFHAYPAGRPELRERVDLRLEPWVHQDIVELVIPGTWEEVVAVVKDRALNREARTLPTRLLP